MNILYLTPHLSTGGMPEFLRERIESFEKNKIDDIKIHVIEFNMMSDTFVVQRNKIKELNIVFESIGDLKDLEKSRFIKEFLENNKIDIIHIDDNIESFTGMSSDVIDVVYSNDRTWRIIETSHNNWFSNEHKLLNPDGYALCSSTHLIKQFLNTDVVSELIEFPVLDKSLEDSPYSGKINILSVGLWTPGKNHKDTLEIARKYLEVNKDVVFNIVGNLADNFRHYWGTLNDVPINFKIWGEQSDMDKFYKNCDIFLFNSLNECNPIAIKEAMSHNKPILLRDLPDYNGAYDSNTERLTDDIDENIKTLNDMVSNIKKYEYDTSYMFYKKNLDLYNRVLLLNPTQNDLNKSKYRIIYFGGPKCEILANNDIYYYNVKFFDNKTNRLIYSTNIKSNHWTSPTIKYCVEWRTEISSDDPDFDDVIDIFTLENKVITIRFDSRSLGDSLAWYPYVKQFRDKHNCDIILKTFKNDLFDESHRISIVDYDKPVDSFITYDIGCYDDPNRNMNPVAWNIIPLGKVCSDILGLDYVETKPLLAKNLLNILPKNIGQKYVIIATDSTSKMKLWNYEDGWKILAKYLKNNGYKVLNISSEGTKIDGVENIKDVSIESTISYIRGSEFFIGLSSGLSWLSWSLDKKCFLINGFIDDICDFSSHTIKIKDESVCNGCWSKFKFTREWEWCPINKGTEDEYICSKAITPEMVIKKIEENIDL